MHETAGLAAQRSDAAHRAATDEEITDMKRRLEAGLQSGCGGRRLRDQLHARGFTLGDPGDVPRGRAFRRALLRPYPQHRRAERGSAGGGDRRRRHHRARRCTWSTSPASASPRRRKLLQMMTEARSRGHRCDHRNVSLHRRHDGARIGHLRWRMAEGAGHRLWRYPVGRDRRAADRGSFARYRKQGGGASCT